MCSAAAATSSPRRRCRGPDSSRRRIFSTLPTLTSSGPTMSLHFKNHGLNRDLHVVGYLAQSSFPAFTFSCPVPNGCRCRGRRRSYGAASLLSPPLGILARCHLLPSRQATTKWRRRAAKHRQTLATLNARPRRWGFRGGRSEEEAAPLADFLLFYRRHNLRAMSR